MWTSFELKNNTFYKMANANFAYSEYKTLLDDLNNEERTKETIYEKLMSKETKIIDLINRVVDTKQQKNIESNLIYNKTFFEMVLMFGHVWRDIINDIFIYRKLKTTRDAITIFYSNERKIYIGITLLLIAFILFYLDISR